jgi:hypothetical protein
MSRVQRHFKDRHSNEPDVIRILLEKDETKQKNSWQHLKNLGNNQHNAEVIWKGEGELIVARAPADPSQWNPHSYAPCDLCFNWYKEDELYRHSCPSKTSGVKPSMRAGKAIRKMMEENLSEGMASVLVGMHEDEVGKAAKSDTLLLQWLELKCSNGFWHQKKWQSLARSRLRLGGRLLIELRKTSPGATLQEFISVEKFDELVAATKACAASATSNKSSAAAPLKMGHLISALIRRKHIMAIKAKNMSTIEEMRMLRELWSGEWGDRITTAAHFAIKERRRMEVPYIPTTEDTVKFATLCKTKLAEAVKGFMEKKTYASYRKLQEAELTRIIQFNRKRGGDVSEATLEDYERVKNMNLSTNDEIFRSLTPEEQEAAKNHHLLVVNGKNNQDNNCILDPLMQEGLDLLVEFREVGKFHAENKFIFAIQNSTNSFLSHSKIRAKYVEEADVHNMAARGMRKYIITNQQVSFFVDLIGQKKFIRWANLGFSILSKKFFSAKDGTKGNGPLFCRNNACFAKQKTFGISLQIIPKLKIFVEICYESFRR